MNCAEKKVLIIDPWGINETGEYTKGLCMGVSRQAQLTLVTNKYFEENENTAYRVLKLFFPKSEKMNDGKKRTVIRGMEYVQAYRRICNLAKAERYDVIHINWLLMYKLDIFFLRRLKRYCSKLVYTAHNVLPHLNGEKNIDDLRAIYGIVDRIILHGRNIKKEFDRLFPEFSHKIYIQKHGFNLRTKRDFSSADIDCSYINKVNSFSRRYIAFGRLDNSKGTDRLLNLWLDEPLYKDVLLIVAGKLHLDYEAVKSRQPEIEHAKNILFIGSFVPDHLLNYLIDASALILLPYRNASMSGVIFTAADFSKPVLCTNVGAFNEYLTDEQDSFFAENDDASIAEKLTYVTQNISVEQMQIMGRALREHIQKECNWIAVTEGLINDVYHL